MPHPPSAAPNTAAPPVLARALALVAILIAGLSGGLIGYAVTDLQCNDGCVATAGTVGVLSAAGAAIGVAIVAVLTMRAMAEWKAQEQLEQARGHQE